MENKQILEEKLKFQNGTIKNLEKRGIVLDLNSLERIPVEEVKNNFGNFAGLEGKWQKCDKDNDINTLKKIFYRLRLLNADIRPGEYYVYYEEDVMINNLKLGKVVEDMFWCWRIITEYPKCPLCGSSIMPSLSAISRRNNITEICSDCGLKEAIEDFTGTIQD